MPRPRKTIELCELKEKVNYHLRLRDDTVSTPESRRAMATLLEVMLMRANAYKGFRYLLSEYDFNRPNPASAGFHLKDNMDETRREYY